MALQEFRRFNFFVVKENVDNGQLADIFQDVRILVCTSGHGHIILGDSSGYVYLIPKLFTWKKFKAYDVNVSLLQQSKLKSFLVSIGEDENGVDSIIKVWNIDQLDKYGNPICLRITRASIPNKAVPTSALAINDNLTFMAVGFTDGSIIVYRGDVTRDRTSKQKLLKDGLTGITGLAFYTSEKTNTTILYVATINSIEVYDVTFKDKETRIHLDNLGCDARCSVMAEIDKENNFLVARNKTVDCYTNGVKGACYAIDGQKLLIEWFRNYLVIVSKDNKSPSRVTVSTPYLYDDSQMDSNKITIFDIQNKFIVFTTSIKDVSAVLFEWGSVFVLTSDNTIYEITEKDLHSKLSLLFKKNFYDVAIKMAKNHQYDTEGLIEIFRQYGDHLYLKGDHKGAIEQYIKTIGKLEPSYVIKKYIDSQQVENLTDYLQALHKEGVANGDHTTLLLNCFTKLSKLDSLRNFVLNKDEQVNFDVDVAIEVCRYVSPEDALLLAEKHNYSWYLTIQIEDQKEYLTALNFIGKLDFYKAEEMIKLYAVVLLEHIPAETTLFLQKLCTDYLPSNNPLVNEDQLNGYSARIPQKANPEDFIQYFLNNSERLVEFLEYMIDYKDVTLSSQVYTTLLEHYLQVWTQPDTTNQRQYSNKIMRLLESQDTKFDKLQALILCKASNFKLGILHLYEQNKMYQAILKYHVAQKDYESVLICCRRFGNQEPHLWIQAMWAIAPQKCSQNVLQEILTVIEKERLLSPLLVIEALSSSAEVTIGDVRHYFKKVFENEFKMIEQDTIKMEECKEKIEKTRAKIYNLQNKPIVFEVSGCSLCNKVLELPTIHFNCQHSFHMHCIQTIVDNENECPTCLPKNRRFLETMKSKEQSRELNEDFHRPLEDNSTKDGFSIITEYLGRGVFTRLSNFSHYVPQVTKINPPIAPELSNNPFEVDKIIENISKRNSSPRPKETENSKNPFDIDDNISSGVEYLKPSTSIITPLITSTNEKIINSITPVVTSSKTKTEDLSKNPFDVDYNEEKIVKEKSSNNPFDEDDDYFSGDDSNPFYRS